MTGAMTSLQSCSPQQGLPAWTTGYATVSLRSIASCSTSGPLFGISGTVVERDGFHALVNYHKLAEGDGKGRRLLESLDLQLPR